jgi:hypothetical protein
MPEVVEWATNTETLQDMRHLSLFQRAEIIRQKFDLAKLGKTSVLRMYDPLRFRSRFPSMNISPRRGKMRDLRSSKSNSQMQLVRLRMNGNLVVFIDETTFHLW